MSKEHPLVLVFYIGLETITSPEVINPLIDSINIMIEKKDLNIITFFVPCAEGDKERIECINPKLITGDEMEGIYKTIDSLKEAFDIGAEVEEIEDTPLDNPCRCGDNPNGNCGC